MIIDTARKGWKTHSLTGRYLNQFRFELHDSFTTLIGINNTGTTKEFMITVSLVNQFKANHPKTNKKTLELLHLLYFRLLTHPNRVVAIEKNEILTAASFKRVIYKMENLGHVEVFQGYSLRAGSRPMVIRSLIENSIRDNHQPTIGE